MTINNIYNKAHENRIRFHEDLVLFPKARESISCVVDGNSALRNTTASIPQAIALPAAAAFVNGSAAVGGILGVPVAAALIRDSYKKGRAAFKSGDLEGVCHNALMGTAGLSFAGISGLLAADGIMGLQGALVPAAVIAAFGATGFGMYGALALYSGYGLAQTRSFGKALKSKNRSQALEWLHQQVRLEPGEGEQQLQKKWNQFELRVGADCARRVREQLPEVMKAPFSQQAEELIKEVEKANLKQQIKHALLFVIALLGIATVFAMILTTGPIAPALFAIGAMLWFTVDSSKLHNYIGEKCWTWHHKNRELIVKIDDWHLEARLPTKPKVHWKSALTD